MFREFTLRFFLFRVLFVSSFGQAQQLIGTFNIDYLFNTAGWQTTGGPSSASPYFCVGYNVDLVDVVASFRDVRSYQETHTWMLIGGRPSVRGVMRSERARNLSASRRDCMRRSALLSFSLIHRVGSREETPRGERCEVPRPSEDPQPNSVNSRPASYSHNLTGRSICATSHVLSQLLSQSEFLFAFYCLVYP